MKKQTPKSNDKPRIKTSSKPPVREAQPCQSFVY
jgi:hypothetical protein